MLSRPALTPRRRLLAVALLALLLAAIVAANALAISRLPSHAAPPPAPPAIAILRTTTTAGYLPTPAGPPATTPDGRVTVEPAAPASPSTGGGR